MALPALVRLVRFAGWIALVGSVGVVIGVTIVESVRGPLADQSVWPTPRLWRCFFTSLAMAGGATALTLILALPAAMALLLATRRWQRSLLLALTIIPLISMPSSFAYAWMLLATSRIAWIARAMAAIGWNQPGRQVAESAWVLATWLWPIPALVIVAAFRHGGRRAYQLACLDAKPTRAMMVGALPSLRGPLIAALAAVFILAATDSTIPPLMSAMQVWSAEMLARAFVASSQARPVAFIFWQAWPMVVAVMMLAALALPGLRQMASWADDVESSDTGSLLPSADWLWWPAFVFVSALTILPIVVYATELANGRTTAMQAIATAYRTLAGSGLATLIVAVSAGTLAVCASVSLLADDRRSTTLKWVSCLTTAALLTSALLPPELIGTALVTFFSRIARPQDWWSVYDYTPWAWVAAMITRFGFLTATVAFALNQRVPKEMLAAAEADGASAAQRLIHARLPVLWRGLAVAGMIVAGLTMSEVAVSVLVQPPRFFGGSLAVAIDSQMHYGRQNETIASALMIMLPVITVAALAPISLGKK